jgi:hypothetical protein
MPAEYPFAAEGGLASSPVASPDPYRQLDELLDLIEIFCPVWPARETFAGYRDWRL